MIDFEFLKKLISLVKYKDWGFFINKLGNGFYLQVQFYEIDPLTGKIEKQHGRKWYISKYSTEDEVIRTCFLAVLTANEHEIRETFYYKKRAIFGPHISLEELFKASNEINLRQKVKI